MKEPVVCSDDHSTDQTLLINVDRRHENLKLFPTIDAFQRFEKTNSGDHLSP